MDFFKSLTEKEQEAVIFEGLKILYPRALAVKHDIGEAEVSFAIRQPTEKPARVIPPPPPVTSPTGETSFARDSVIKGETSFARDSVIKGETSFALGRQGEDYIEKALGTLEYSVTAKTPHSGDFIVFTGERKIMIESKNYKNRVPGAEVEKFERDLASADGGVFISLRSAITGIPQKIYFMQSRLHRKPCIYISEQDATILPFMIRIVQQFIDSTSQYVHSDAISGICSRLNDKLIALDVCRGKIARARNAFIGFTNEMYDFTLQFTQDISTMLAKLAKKTIDTEPASFDRSAIIEEIAGKTKVSRALVEQLISAVHAKEYLKGRKDTIYIFDKIEVSVGKTFVRVAFPLPEHMSSVPICASFKQKTRTVEFDLRAEVMSNLLEMLSM